MFETRMIQPDRDLPAWQALFESVFGGQVSREQWEWKYCPPWADGPHAIVSFEGGKLVGHIGVVELRGWVAGEELPFFQICDVMVARDFRARHEYLKLWAELGLGELGRCHPRRVMYGFSAHRAYLYFRRLGLAELVERPQEVVVRPRELDRALKGSDIEVREWNWENPEINRLWERLKTGMAMGLIRDGLYLCWRYQQHLINYYRLFGAYIGGEPIGWIVVDRTWYKHEETKRKVRVVDLMLPEGTIPAVTAAAAEVLDTEEIFLWLPSSTTPGRTERHDDGVHLFHMPRWSYVSTTDMREDLFYTLGDVDWN